MGIIQTVTEGLNRVVTTGPSEDTISLRQEFETRVREYNSYTPTIADALNKDLDSSVILYETNGSGDSNINGTDLQNEIAETVLSNYSSGLGAAIPGDAGVQAAINANSVINQFNTIDRYLDTAESMSLIDPRRWVNVRSAEEQLSIIQNGLDNQGEDGALGQLRDL
jgi:hypothetical protein